MKRYRITTPEAGHTEVIGTVSFVGGVAECDADPDAAPLKYFRAQGYGVSVQDDAGEWVPEPAPDEAATRAEKIAAMEAELAALKADEKPDEKPDEKAPAESVKPAKATKAAAKSEESPA